MKSKSWLSLIGLLLLAAGPAAIAQETAPARQERKQAALFDLAFAGGSASDLDRAIEEATGEPLNLMIPESGNELRIPPFQVKRVSVESLLLSLGVDETLPIRYGRSIQYARQRFWFEKGQGGSERDEVDIWKLKVDSVPVPPPFLMVKPVNVAELLERYSIDDLSTAIHLAWDSGEDMGTAPELKFHAETKLLVARGTEEQLDLMTKVLQLLGNIDASPVKSGEPIRSGSSKTDAAKP